MARPVLQQTKVILATPIVCRPFQWVLVLLQHITYDPRLCELVRRIVMRGARKNMRDAENGQQKIEPGWHLARQGSLGPT